MHRYASVILDIAAGRLDRPFTYRVPQQLSDVLYIGSYVQVPFGRGDTMREGYIVSFSDRAEYPDEKIKEIISVCTRGTDASGDFGIALAAWMKKYYGASMGAALKTVLTTRHDVRPVQSRQVTLKADEKLCREKLAWYEKKHQVARARLLRELISAPSQPYSLLTEKLHISPQTMRAMKEQGIIDITTTSSLRNPVEMADVPENADLILSPEQKNIVEGVLADFDAIAASRRDWALPDDYEPAGASGARKTKKGTSEPHGSQEVPGGPGDQDGSGKVSAGPDERLRKARRVSLIHGITGSGKTEVYISIIEGIVRRGCQAIMLIPEISLTYQTLMRFYRHFGSRVSVMNSTLSDGEKSDQFERARMGEIDVIIGPRSALFTPFAHTGVIIMDEEHEASYKNESMPKYHAREVAIQIAKMSGAVVVLGSATPSMESYWKAAGGEYRLYELRRRLTGGCLPEVETADMRAELQSGNKGILSRRLQELITDRLEKREQIMLFLNRRGYSGFVSCRSCGHVMKCPHCDVSLSLHANGKLVCHYCGFEQPMVSKCPSCGSRYVFGFKAGTESIEAQLTKMYPAARILRMDADTTRQKGSYEKILSAFSNEEADILLGTQMIVKGHDFPKVTLVGILLADLSLYAGDYRAGERTFQLLTQAAGRAGRGVLPGNVVIQTYDPDHYALRHAVRQDYNAFFEEEIRYRQLLRYPPCVHMLAVQIFSRTQDHALYAGGMIRERLDRISGMNKQRQQTRVQSDQPETRMTSDPVIIGPASASISRLRDDYRFVIYVKSEKYDKLIRCKEETDQFLQEFSDSPLMKDVQIQYDFDPVNGF